MTYKSTNRPGLPEPALAHEMWSREICDRLDHVIRNQERLLESQNRIAEILSASAEPETDSKEITEPAAPKASARKVPASAPARSRTT